MSDDTPVSLPEPGTLRVGAPPYWHGWPGIAPITLTFLVATSIVLAAGLVLFGWNGLRVLAISVASALLAGATFNLLAQRTRSWSESHALLVGALFACTLPPTVSWYVPVTGAVLAVLIGQVLPGGVGNYLWHPAALGRVVVQMLFHDEVTPERWPVLAPGRLIWGSLSGARPLPPLWRWASQPAPGGVQAWSAARPVDHLRAPLETEAGTAPAEALAALLRDAMPPWPDTLTGTAGGAVGEACLIAAVVAGLLLMWGGFLRGRMAVAAIASAAILAALLPVRIQPEGGPVTNYWLPGVAFWQGLPVGLVYVCYHLTAGEFLLVLLLFAPDPSSSPLTSRGHALFGLIIGTATMLLRIVAGIPAAGYWALLIANTLVPVINRKTRRRVLGT